MSESNVGPRTTGAVTEASDAHADTLGMQRAKTCCPSAEQLDDEGTAVGGADPPEMGQRAHTEPLPLDQSYVLPRHDEINYDLDLPSDQHASPVRRSSPIDRYRQRNLKVPFASIDEENMFNMSFSEWKAAERSVLPGWRCSVKSPVSLSDVAPYAKDDLHILDKISIVRCGVTELAVEAIVNAANEECLGGGGVDGAIHSAAGHLLRRECSTFNGCKTGHTRITKGYYLPARFVLHTVGPIGEKPRALQSCYRSCLQLAMHHGLRSVGFCCISTGIFGYPLAAATAVALRETFTFLKEHRDNFDMLCFACFTEREHEVYTSAVDQIYREVMTHDTKRE